MRNSNAVSGTKSRTSIIFYGQAMGLWKCVFRINTIPPLGIDRSTLSKMLIEAMLQIWNIVNRI